MEDPSGLRPSQAEFRALARRHSVVPVSIEVLADRLTPVSAFERLVGDRPGFLLESVEGGERWARWSFLGWDPAFTAVGIDGRLELRGTRMSPPGGDPLSAFEELLGEFTAPELPDLPPLHGGAVGYLSYDVARHIEHLPGQPPDDRGLPEMLWHFTGSMAALDRFRQTLTLVRNVYGPVEDPDASYEEAVSRLEAALARLAMPGAAGAPGPRPSFTSSGVPPSNMAREDFEDAVRQARDHIRRGDVYQVVLSQRFEVPYTGDLFPVYRALRLVNPSPFLFFLRFPGLMLAGSSPELMVRSRAGRVVSRPIAGTRPRGSTAEEDARLAEDLLADPKERAEHVMLVDLARNDVGRISEFGSVRVDELMVVERYSHVMHIVSEVSGDLRRGTGPVDVLRATFPHGTVSGAPKVRAMEIIDELEPVARGPYAGAVGYIDFSGNLDTAITLRTVVSDGTRAWVQAGAGVVADSDPAAEYQETLYKAAGALAALGGSGEV